MSAPTMNSSTRPSPVAGDPPSLFVLGAPRSGTSLVYRILCMHPDLAWINNWHRLAPWFPESAVLNRLATRLPDSRQERWFPSGNAYVYNSSRSLLDRLFPNPVEGEPVFAHHGLGLTGPEGGRDDADVADALARMMRRVRAAGGGSQFVSKRIAHNHRAAWLAERLPGARFVHVVRDGRAVADSLLRVDWWPEHALGWWHDRTPRQWEAAGNDPWEAAGREWAAEITAASGQLGAVEPARVHVVRYEDLMTDPRTGMERLAEFAGLAPAAREFQRGIETITPRRPGAPTRKQLDPDVEGRLMDIQGHLLRDWGYE